jgi:hypothetical protein
MLHHVAPVRTHVSEELSASIINVTRISELGTTLAVTSNRCTLLLCSYRCSGRTHLLLPFLILFHVHCCGEQVSIQGSQDALPWTYAWSCQLPTTFHIGCCENSTSETCLSHHVTVFWRSWEKSWKTSFRIACGLAVIQIEHLLKASIECYRYADVLSATVTLMFLVKIHQESKSVRIWSGGWRSVSRVDGIYHSSLRGSQSDGAYLAQNHHWTWSRDLLCIHCSCRLSCLPSHGLIMLQMNHRILLQGSLSLHHLFRYLACR